MAVKLLALALCLILAPGIKKLVTPIRYYPKGLKLSTILTLVSALGAIASSLLVFSQIISAPNSISPLVIIGVVVFWASLAVLIVSFVATLVLSRRIKL